MYHSQRQSGPPRWFVFIIGIAMIFGLYYLWVGVQDYMESGGVGIREATELAATQIFATEEREAIIQANIPTRRPSVTPLPECQDFIVTVPSAIVRAEATTGSAILDSLPEGTQVCVIEHMPDSEWYLVDRNTTTRRLEPAYMHEDIIQSLNPTPTPSNTFTPAPTVTMTPSLTPSDTPTVGPSNTPDPNSTDTPTPSPTPTDTPDNVSA